MNDDWIQTVSGMDVDLLDPKPEQISLGDIARSLSRIPRFVGHTVGDTPWSVAQHSLLVESLMPDESVPDERLAALLHDAHEAYVGDLPSPVKAAMDRLFLSEAKPSDLYVGAAPTTYFKTITNRLDDAIHAAFGLKPSPATLDRIKAADLLALRIEADALMMPRRREWAFLPPAPEPPIDPRPALQSFRAEAVFLDRFRVLHGMRHKIAA